MSHLNPVQKIIQMIMLAVLDYQGQLTSIALDYHILLLKIKTLRLARVFFSFLIFHFKLIDIDSFALLDT